MKLLIIIIAISLPFLVSAEEALPDISMDEIKVLKISSQDERAVIKTPEKRAKMIKVGDRIGNNSRVIEIAKGRVVIEEFTKRGAETVIIRVENGKQTVEKVTKMLEPQKILLRASQESKKSSRSANDSE